MHESDFLAAIAAAPEDTALRLVYADWLEDRGDARAELIRAVEERKTLQPWSERYYELGRRANVLRAGVAAEWLTALDCWSYRPLFRVMPDERAERWRLLREFIGTWWEPPPSVWGYSEQELQFGEQGRPYPWASLREYHTDFGRLVGTLSRQLPRLLDDARPQFRSTDFYVLGEQADPAVGVGYRREDRERECDSASEFIIFTAVRMLLQKAPIQRMLRLPAGSPLLAELNQQLSPCAFRLLGPVSRTVQLREGFDLITLDYQKLTPEEPPAPLFVFAKSLAAFDPFSSRLRDVLRGKR